MKGYIIKYALTKGIIETELQVNSAQLEGLVHAPALGESAVFHGLGKEWCWDRRQAKAAGEAQRQKKITNLLREIARLKVKNIEVIHK